MNDDASTCEERFTEWSRPSESYHAHWDCFSGAAGDMMLAACLDASDNGPTLMSHIQRCIERGLPELRGEFSLEMKRVWKSDMGSIAANYVTVNSRYKHAPAPVPTRTLPEESFAKHSHDHSHTHKDEGESYNHYHSQGHSHSHTHAQDSETSVGQETRGGSRSHRHNHSSDTHSQNHGHDTTGPLRNLPQIRGMLLDASTQFIPVWVRDHAIDAFTELAEAEAMTHGASSPDTVLFHEVGAIDSIVDTVGTLLALDCLGVRTISCSRLPLGEGTVWTAHGLLPVPAPATLRLLLDMPTCPGPPGITGELLTPTAAALLRVLAKSSKSKVTGRPPCFTIRKVGIGAGTKEFAKHPNIVRLMIGDSIQR
jgi:uncharacterized protein (DUF111 family)